MPIDDINTTNNLALWGEPIATEIFQKELQTSLGFHR